MFGSMIRLTLGLGSKARLGGRDVHVATALNDGAATIVQSAPRAATHVQTGSGRIPNLSIAATDTSAMPGNAISDAFAWRRAPALRFHARP